ncbi:MAG: hypothetical protein HYR97_01485 [Candidatus Melainabacteria bacterium]|nr:hypothetical protein [Candidatus Melainabacteria bacterium]
MGNTITSILVERVTVANPIQAADPLNTKLDEFKDYLDERKVLLKAIVLTALSYAIHSGKTSSDLRIKMDDLPPEIAKAKLTDSATFHKLAKETGIDELTQEIQAQGFKFDIQANKNPDGSYKGKIEVIVSRELLRSPLGGRAIIFDRVNLLNFILGHLLKEQAIKGYSNNPEETLDEARASYNYNKRMSLKFDLDVPENSNLTLHTPEITLEDIDYLLNKGQDTTRGLTDEGKILLGVGFIINNIYEEYLIQNIHEPFTFSYVKNEMERNPEEWNCHILEKTPISENKDLITDYIERLKEIARLAT